MSRKKIERWVEYYGGIRLCEIGPQGGYTYGPIGTVSNLDDPRLTDEQREAIGWATPEEAVVAIRKDLIQRAKELRVVAKWLQTQAQTTLSHAHNAEKRAEGLEKEVVR